MANLGEVHKAVHQAAVTQAQAVQKALTKAGVQGLSVIVPRARGGKK